MRIYNETGQPIKIVVMGKNSKILDWSVLNAKDTLTSFTVGDSDKISYINIELIK